MLEPHIVTPYLTNRVDKIVIVNQQISNIPKNSNKRLMLLVLFTLSIQ